MDERQQLKEILNHVADGVYMTDRHRRIQFWNQSAQRITGFSAAEVTGRCCAENILTHVDQKGCAFCTGMCPLAHTLSDGEPREDVVNLHHKDGHRVPVKVAISALRDEAGRIVGAVETFHECGDVLALRSAIERLKQWGCVEVSTGLVNRRIVEGRLQERIQELQRFGWPFAVLLIEMDLLHEICDVFGEEGRLAALRMAAMSVQNALRSLDLVGHWDKEMFLAVIANTTVAELVSISERVRMMVDTAYRELEMGQLHVTVSIGAVGADQRDNLQSILQKASHCLYQSRSSGRNRVTIHGLVE